MIKNICINLKYYELRKEQREGKVSLAINNKFYLKRSTALNEIFFIYNLLSFIISFISSKNTANLKDNF